MCSNPCESEVTCFRPESNRGPYGLLNFLSAALSTTELWWRMNHRKSFRTLTVIEENITKPARNDRACPLSLPDPQAPKSTGAGDPELLMQHKKGQRHSAGKILCVVAKWASAPPIAPIHPPCPLSLADALAFKSLRAGHQVHPEVPTRRSRQHNRAKTLCRIVDTWAWETWTKCTCTTSDKETLNKGQRKRRWR